MKKRFTLIWLFFIVSCLFQGCVKKQTTADLVNSKEPLKMWVGVNQGERYRALVKEFSEREKVVVEVVEIEEADDALLKDTEVAADVIRLPHDQLGQLVEAGTVYENEKYAEFVKEENIEMAVQGATYQNKLYGYPASAEAMFLFYDKRVY